MRKPSVSTNIQTLRNVDKKRTCKPDKPVAGAFPLRALVDVVAGAVSGRVSRVFRVKAHAGGITQVAVAGTQGGVGATNPVTPKQIGKLKREEADSFVERRAQQ